MPLSSTPSTAILTVNTIRERNKIVELRPGHYFSNIDPVPQLHLIAIKYIELDD
jgi:hypothetical protein